MPPRCGDGDCCAAVLSVDVFDEHVEFEECDLELCHGVVMELDVHREVALNNCSETTELANLLLNTTARMNLHNKETG